MNKFRYNEQLVDLLSGENMKQAELSKILFRVYGGKYSSHCKNVSNWCLKHRSLDGLQFDGIKSVLRR